MTAGEAPRRPPERDGRLEIDAADRFFWWDEGASAAWTVEPGETVRIEAVDGWNGRIRSAEDTAADCPPGETNPCTGPIRVEGARPGLLLAFELTAIECLADHAVSVIMPGWGVLGDRVTEPRTHVLPVAEGTIELPGGVSRPTRPMVGTIGVTPAGEPVATLVPGSFGGNMDVPEIAAGSRLYLPVQIPGAGFGLGDSKALMGEGESAAAGAEIPVAVTGRFGLLDGPGVRGPLVRTADEWLAVASAETVEAAGETAFAQMTDLVSAELGLGWDEARVTAGLAGALRICQTANPLVTVAYHLPREAVDFAWGDEGFDR